jgi:hypothetical protein
VLTIRRGGRVPAVAGPADPVIEVGDATTRRLPAIGLGQGSHGRALTEAEARRIRALRPSHLRVDLEVSTGPAGRDLERAAVDARAVGAELELAISANDDSAGALADLAGRLASLEAGVARVLVYQATSGYSAVAECTPASVVNLVRAALEPVTGQVVFAGGTNQNFSEVNRDRPTDPTVTGLCFSTSPTVHAADDISVMENVAGQGEVVRMARAIGGDRAICVSPVTLATRFGPYPDGPAEPGGLPPAVDVRQASLLGAAWTAGALASLADAGASSVTLFETTGWRGAIETDAGNPMPDRFPSSPGDVFPLYHVLCDLGEWRDGVLIRAVSSDPQRAVSLVIGTPDGRRHALVANLTTDPVQVALTGLPNGPARLRLLDLAKAPAAIHDPDAFRDAGSQADVADGRMTLDLGPYAVARIDCEAV